jgi:hypothetical protein
MNISLGEALAILSGWKNAGNTLKVHSVKAGHRQEFSGRIEAIKAASVTIASNPSFQVDLQNAEFNGGDSPSAGSKHRAYLVCEFANGDRCSFYLPRNPGGSSLGQHVESKS